MGQGVRAVQQELVLCAQCYEERPRSEFVGRSGAPVKHCSSCRAKYSGDYGERASVPRRGLRVIADEPRVTWAPESGNKKLGGIGGAIVSPETCPPSCGFYGRGCYHEFGFSGLHWRNVAERGLPWDEFLAAVRAQPEGALWRYAVAGDLPGVGERLDVPRLQAMAEANRGRRGFTFTHKRLEAPGELEAVAAANAAGFTINLSADTLEQADERAQLGVGPVAVVVPTGAPRKLRTPAGRPVFLCPAQAHQDVTCANCQICARPRRAGVVAFEAHGQMKHTVSKIACGGAAP